MKKYWLWIIILLVLASIISTSHLLFSGVLKITDTFERHISEKTYDSSFILTYPYKGIEKIMVVCDKNGQQTKDVYIVSNTTARHKGYLRMGPGKYEVKFYKPWYDNKYLKYKSINIYNCDTRSETVTKYLLPEGDIQCDDPEIIALAHSITRNSSTDMQKTAAIHDWIVNNIVYDTQTRLYGKLEDYNWDALEALHRGTTLCGGYANLTAALNRAVGLPARVVEGDAIVPDIGQTWADIGPDTKHAWNEVYIDGRWIIQDVTWDAGYVDPKRKIFICKYTSKYFNPDSTTFSLDHREDPDAL